MGVRLVSTLRNDGGAPLPLSLSAGTPVSKTAGKVPVATVTLTTVDPASRPPAGKVLLPVGELVDISIDLKGTLDAGEWEIEVRNGGTPVGMLAVVVPPPPSAVKFDGTSGDHPELLFERGKPATIPLKNDDGVGYEVSGQYSVRGVVKGAEKPIFLSNNGGGGELTLLPPDPWFAVTPQALFKDDVVDGRLSLRFTSPVCPGDPTAPVRVFKVKTTLATWGAPVKDFRGNLILLATLFLGGVFSLTLNFFLPAHGRRRRVRAQVSVVARRIDDLPVQGDPLIRASVALEGRQLADRLRRLKFYDMQFSPEMAEIEGGLTRLCTRLDLLSQMDLVLSRYWRYRSVIVSDDIEELRRQLIEFLRRSDPGDGDIQTAQALIKKINDLLTNVTAANPDLAGRLVARVSKLRSEFDATKPDTVGASPEWKKLRADLIEDFDEVLGPAPPTDPEKIKPSDYAPLARAVFVLTQVSDFIKLCGATGASGSLTTEQKDLRDRLMLNLRGGSWNHLNRAERLIRQMREGISYADIEDHIQRNLVTIDPTRIVVRQFEPTELRVMLLNKKFNASAAREEYTPRWEFEWAKLEITGWSASLFFPLATDPEPQPPEHEGRRWRKAWRALSGRATVEERADGAAADGTAEATAQATQPAQVFSKPYRVSVTFVRDDGFKVPGKVTREIRVRPPLAVKVRASFWMELLRFSLALGIATTGLMAGARDQILKLDVFPALIAVFLLGFGSDRIKNIFSQRASEEPKPGAPA